MDMFKNPIDQLVSELGGTSKVALGMGVRPSVVSSWRATGKLPRWRIEPLLAFAKAHCPTIAIPWEISSRLPSHNAALNGSPTGQAGDESGEVAA